MLVRLLATPFQWKYFVWFQGWSCWYHEVQIHWTQIWLYYSLQKSGIIFFSVTSFWNVTLLVSLSFGNRLYLLFAFTITSSLGTFWLVKSTCLGDVYLYCDFWVLMLSKRHAYEIWLVSNFCSWMSMYVVMRFSWPYKMIMRFWHLII